LIRVLSFENTYILTYILYIYQYNLHHIGLKKEEEKERNNERRKEEMG